MRKSALIVLALCAAMLVPAGCGKGPVPEGASYSFTFGKLASEEPGTVTELHAAVLKALKTLELPVAFNKKDNLVAVIQTFTSEGESIQITIHYRSVDVSELRFESDDRVDVYKLSGLLEEIRKNMSVI
ncbi:hypothetical protein GGQ74_001380 [Desulfobaculum xiamenense]|uniref:DUF3568 family protein n=1 Tax=Desulfobaculum xiamenense TaxID=995050 RepID=A0A846QL12_9BACT|nr:DUF3568 family protein [Desulfobaculum xiamenense]NJB67740.1 hypothetical protein [Desulfobaculum xiamenense]